MFVAQRRDAGTRVAILFLRFLWRSKRKGVARRGDGAASDSSKKPGRGFDARLRQAQPEREKDGSGKEIRDRAFSGSEHKFPEPLARPAGAAQRNCDLTPKTSRFALRNLPFVINRLFDPLQPGFEYVTGL